MAASDISPTADVRPWNIQPPSARPPAPEQVSVHYMPRTDSLFLFIVSPERPTVGFVADRHLTLLLDPATDEMLGIEIDHFLSEAVFEYPEYVPFLALPQLPRRQVARVRKRIDPVPETAAAMRDFIDRIFGGNGPTGGLASAFN